MGNGRACPCCVLSICLYSGAGCSAVLSVHARSDARAEGHCQGQTAEIRCTLKRGGDFADTHYTIRYFQPDGKGTLKMDDGTVFKPNDRYPLTKDVFRLYYTSLSSDRQTIDVYVEDSFGKVQQLTFSFNNEREEGKDKHAFSRH